MKYVNAWSAEEALEALIEAEGTGRIIAGGTDVMIDLGEGKLPNVKVLVDVSKAKDMRKIRKERHSLVIGATATLTEIATSPLVKRYYPSLAKGAGSVGSLQIRNSGTLVGNVIAAQPAADATMAAAPLDPTFVVFSKEGIRTLKISEMYAGFAKSALDPSKEIVKEVRFPLPEDDEKAAFYRLELRKSLSLPMLNAAAMIKYTEGKVAWARITMGPVGVGPVRAEKAEQWLVGKALTPENMQAAGKLALENAKPRSNPLRGSKEYREHSLPIIIRRVLEDIASQFENK